MQMTEYLFFSIYCSGFTIVAGLGIVTLKLWYKEETRWWWSEGLFAIGEILRGKNDRDSRLKPYVIEYGSEKDKREVYENIVWIILRNTIITSLFWPLSFSILLFVAVIFAMTFEAIKTIDFLNDTWTNRGEDLFDRTKTSMSRFFYPLPKKEKKIVKVLKESESYRELPQTDMIEVCDNIMME